MAKAKHFSTDGKVVGEVDLPGPFTLPANEHVVWEVVKAQLANRRQGTASTKTISDVSGGGRKPWRQKGTGRARQGSNRATQWRGGATVFGPRPRSYRMEMPRKIRRLALVSTLSRRAEEGNVAVVDRFELEAPRTKTVASFMEAAGFRDRKVCFITETAEPGMVRSCRNIPGVQVLTRDTLNVYDLLDAEVLLFTPDALEKVGEVYGS
jgi:large subunit ribosomal protein L4